MYKVHNTTFVCFIHAFNRERKTVKVWVALISLTKKSKQLKVLNLKTIELFDDFFYRPDY